MSSGINFRSGNLDVSLNNNAGLEHTFQTVQSLDFAFDDAIEVMDSLNQQRLGYFAGPRRLTINMGVIPAEYGEQATNDARVLQQLQAFLASNDQTTNPYTSGIFDLTISDTNQGATYKFKDCIINDGSPGVIVIDQRPASQWTILALDVTITAGSESQSAGTGEPADSAV